MKKIYWFALGVLMVPGLSLAKMSIDEIDDAIEQSKISRVKSLLHRFDEITADPQKRLKAYYDFYDAAAEVVDQKTDNLSLIGDKRDIAKTISGTLLSLAGGAAGILGYLFSAPGDGTGTDGRNTDQQERACTLGKVAGPVACLGGLYLFYKGITCSTQQRYIDEARAIEMYIDHRIEGLEKPQESNQVQDGSQ